MDCFKDVPLGHWSVEMFLRLIAFDLVSESIDRMLYLDGDMVVYGSLETLSILPSRTIFLLRVRILQFLIKSGRFMRNWD